MKSRVQVSFKVMDFPGSADAITAVLGVQPTRTWKAGDRVPNTALMEKENGWSFEWGKASAEQFETAVRGLLQVLKGSRAQLEGVSKNYYAELSCAFYIYSDERPPLHIGPEAVRRLGELGAHIDVDLYFFDAE